MSAERCWYLEGFLGEERVLRRFPVRERSALCVGRRGTLDLCIADHTVSSLHAELYVCNGVLHLRDLGSSNGTFVNRVRVTGEVALAEGDAVHFCRNEFRVGRAPEPDASEEADRTTRTSVRAPGLPGQFSGGREMLELIDEQRVRVVYQPIRPLGRADTDHPEAYELLGRGSHPRLPRAPAELFRIADAMGAATRLSAVFRDIGILQARQLPGDPNIFFNTHPVELGDPQMLAGLRRLRRDCPDLGLTIEIHEAVAATRPALGELRARLRDIDIGLAYDDFGAGQGRLVMLADTPPDYLKFDMSLVRGIDQASSSRQRLLEGLIKNVRDMGIPCVAEGVETAGELAVCNEMGFDHAQGFHLGRPAPLECWLHGGTVAVDDADAPPDPAGLGKTTALPRELVQSSL